MFKIIDRYILAKFLSTFLFVVTVLTLVICVIDFVEKNEDFIQNKPGLAKILGVYYLNFAPYYANMLSPITVFIAAVFVTVQLATRTEIIAILSSGVSFLRFMVPYFIGSIIIGVCIFFLNGYVIPRANSKRVAFEVQYLKDQFTYSGRNIHLKVGPTTYAYLESYSNQLNTGYRFTLESIINRKLTVKTTADRFVWVPQKKCWRLETYTIRTFDSTGKENFVEGVALDTVLRLTPQDFSSDYMRYETLTTPELTDYLAEMQMRGADNTTPYQIEKYLRVTYPFAIVILTIIAVILSARKSRGGAGFQITLGLILAFVYIIFFIMSRSIAQAGFMNPLLACWLPNIVFTGIGVLLYKTVPR
jgi:lipopolysaccharide export system permease protein